MPTENRPSSTEIACAKVCGYTPGQSQVELRLDQRRPMPAWLELGETVMVLPSAQHQGDLVHMVRSHGSECWEEMSGESLEFCQAQPEEYEVRALYGQPAPVTQQGEPVASWRDMATAPRDGTLVRLLVRFTEHSTEDQAEAPTIGANNLDNTEVDEWLFAGWSWEQDCFTQGAGEPIGWLPLLDEQCTDSGEVERLRATVEAQLHLIRSLREELIESYRTDGSDTLSALSASAAPIAPVDPYPNRLCHIDYQAHPYLCGCLRGDEEAQKIYDDHIRSAKS